MNKQSQTKIPVTLEDVKQAFQIVKTKGKAVGVDAQTVEQFEENLENNIYVIWNRIVSGSYFTKPVRTVKIPKSNGKVRKLGISTIRDRIFQTVMKEIIESPLEKIFVDESFGYRRNKNAHGAISSVRTNCWRMDWVADLDISKFFDTIDHGLLMKAVDKHIKDKWLQMYIKRFLETPTINEEEKMIENKGIGIPQGGVLSPLLANLFLHYAFDKWFKIKFRNQKFTRYADDIIVHCQTKSEAEKMINSISTRLSSCKLKLNLEKSKIIYCKDDTRRGNHDKFEFEFLGYTFRPRKKMVRKSSKLFCGFDLAISKKAEKKIISEVKRIVNRNSGKSLKELITILNPKLRGWINYFSKPTLTQLQGLIRKIDDRIAIWLKKKYKSLKGSIKQARNLVAKLKNSKLKMFVHWEKGIMTR